MSAEPTTARYTVVETDNFLRITIPPRRRRWQAVSWGIAECLWGAAIVFLLTQSRPPLLFFVFGSLLLIVGVLHGSYRIGWELAGGETITVTRDALVQVRSIGSLVRQRWYSLGGVTQLRLPLEHGSWWAEVDANPKQGPRGIIQFDYHGRRKRIGIGLRVPEAQAILAALESRLARR